MEALIDFDQALFLFLNGLHHPFMDEVMWYVTKTTTWIPFYAFLLYLAFKQLGPKAMYAFIPAIVVVIVMADQGSVQLFKNVFQRWRPCHEPVLEGLVHSVRNKCGGEWGFISSHASNTFGLAGFLGLTLTKKLGKWMLLWAAVVSYSRIYLGVHYPGDILGGALFGLLCGATGAAVYRALRSRFGSKWGNT